MNPNVENGSTLKRYMLGELDHEEQQRLEREIMTDNHTFEQLSVAEDELVEEYLEGSLSAREREKFEKHFLSTPKHREELRLAKALRRYVVEKKSESKVPFWKSLLAPLRTQPAFLKHALSVVLVLAVVGGAWSARQARRSSQEIAQIRAQQTTSQDQMQDLQRQLGEQRSRNLQMAEELQRREAQGSVTKPDPVAVQQPTLVAFALTRGLVRDAGILRRVVVPSGASLVELRLELVSPDYPSYRAMLQDAAEEEIITQNKLKASKLGDGHIVVVTLPVSLVPRGDYSLKLSGRSAAGDFEDLGSYYLRVIKK
jgi:hypothetical protein